GGTTTSSSGAGGATSTGAGMGGSGGLPSACTDPAAKACTGAGQCVLNAPGCCVCGMPELSGVVALNAPPSPECVWQGAGCGCGPFDTPSLAASCEAGSCVGWDVRKEDKYSGCTTDTDCHLRMGLGCCEACQGGTESVVAVNAGAEPGLATALCS